jgi:hypothetical protein
LRSQQHSTASQPAAHHGRSSSTVQHSIACSTAQYAALLKSSSTAQHHSMQPTMGAAAAQHSTAQHAALLKSSSTAQHNSLRPTMGAAAAQYSSTAQHLSMQQQHSTVTCISACTNLQPTMGADTAQQAQHAATHRCAKLTPQLLAWNMGTTMSMHVITPQPSSP